MDALGSGSWILRKESFDIIKALDVENRATSKFLLCILTPNDPTATTVEPLLKDPLAKGHCIPLNKGQYF